MARRKLDINVQNFRNGRLQADNVYVNPKIESISELTGMETRKGIENFLTTDKTPGKPDDGRIIIANVSNDYGFLPNEQFFPQIEERLEGAGIEYEKRTINRNNRSFIVDYILKDDSMHVNVKTKGDIIKPFFRTMNTYDSSGLTSGHFGIFRRICSNGLHIADTQVSFGQRHRGNMIEIVMPKIEILIAEFMDNEFYSLHRKFHVLAETPISNLEGFVKYTLEKTGLFKYEKSKKSDKPSVGAQFIIDTINMEAQELGTKPNLWLGYNAINEYIHTQSEKVFLTQELADKQVFAAVLEQAN